MNFLAHLYLSFGHKEIMIGNFIADHVKGKQSAGFPAAVRAGILLHRAIDSFTDHHPVVAETKARLRPVFRKYAPVVSDVYYDHFLASEWDSVSETPLPLFAESFYKLAFQHLPLLPERTQRMLPVMKEYDWLNKYKTIEGIGSILTAMSRRTAFESGMENAAAELEKNYDAYKKEFREFFPELTAFSKSELLKHLEG